MFLSAVGCVNPPEPTADLFLERSGYVEDQIVEFEKSVTYTCISGYKFIHDFYETSFTATCLSNGTWDVDLPLKGCVLPEGERSTPLVFPRHLGRLLHVVQRCPNPPTPSTAADNGGEYDWQSVDVPVYPRKVTYTCKEGRSLRNTVTNALDDNQEIQCFWNKTWSTTQVRFTVTLAPRVMRAFKIHECEWTHCIDPDDVQNMNNDYTTPILLGRNLTYTCKPNNYFESDRSKTSVAVKCLNNGSFDYPQWPNCIASEKH